MKEELEKIIGGTKQFIKSKVSVGILAAGLALGYAGCYNLIGSKAMGRVSPTNPECPNALECGCTFDNEPGTNLYTCVDPYRWEGATDEEKCRAFCCDKVPPANRISCR